MHKRVYAIFITLLLIGCSDGTPMKITEQYRNYVGTWQFRYENIESNSIKIDNMLLVIRNDGTAIYRQCVVNETKSKNYRSSSRSSTRLPEAAVTQITKNKINLVQELGWFGFKKELNLDKAPYQENGNWYIGVEGKKLIKIIGQDINMETNWNCPGDEE